MKFSLYTYNYTVEAFMQLWVERGPSSVSFAAAAGKKRKPLP